MQYSILQYSARRYDYSSYTVLQLTREMKQSVQGRPILQRCPEEALRLKASQELLRFVEDGVEA